ncbi:hypothetical protein Tco_1080517 [Tanacetum coccineum]|uniref:Uncharacterized protein n=1 Tax=Tanacetum coccineum TaxID=301880 RepID=A0ABQ5HWV0_9ASTR
MVVRVPPTMSSGFSASMVEVAAMSESTFRKRFRSSYESSPSLSPPDLPSRKRYRGMSELVEDSEEDEDDDEDEEIEESMDSDSVSEGAEDEGPTAEDEGPTAEDEGLTVGVEGPSMDDESYGLDGGSHGGRGGRTWGSAAGSSGCGDNYDHTFKAWVWSVETPEWTSGSLPVSPSPSVIPSPISSPMIPLTVPSPIATPATVETEGFLTELGAQGENQDLRLQLAEERCARLELAEIVDGMRRGQEPKGAQFCSYVSALRLVARDRADTHFLIRM